MRMTLEDYRLELGSECTIRNCETCKEHAMENSIEIMTPNIDMDPAEKNHFWTNPFWLEGTSTQVICRCGKKVDIDGPLEDQHFVFAMRKNRERIYGMERSNLGYCPKSEGFDTAVYRARLELGVAQVYYRGHAL